MSLKSATVVLMAALGGAHLTAAARAQPAAVPKTNPLKVYMHYMPWFETPATLGGQEWGYHWKLKNRNPNVIDVNGRRQIASHYYPKIGPYASRDADVIEYHLLLMKYAGVDGVLIDWYGVQGTNSDIGNLLTSSNAIVEQVDDFGLQFGVGLEDRFSTVSSADLTPDVNKGKANMAYLRNNYFNRPSYIRQNAGADPLVGVFGPIRFQQPSQWAQILAEAGEDVDFLTLWYEKNGAGANADGEYAWIYQDAGRTHLQHQADFYRFRAPTLGTAGGVAYPGFDDFYEEGGVGDIIPFDISHNNGQTLAGVLNLVGQHQQAIDFVQLATWNDFGEGTMFEPTVETGFSYLAQVQAFTGVSYSEAELELVYRLYRARKKHAGDAAVQALLDQASADLSALEVEAARTLLDQIAPAGDFDNDGDADGADLLKWQQQLGATGLYPVQSPAADANADGVVNAQDLALWQANLSPALNADIASIVPEPRAAWLLLAALAATRRPSRKLSAWSARSARSRGPNRDVWLNLGCTFSGRDDCSNVARSPSDLARTSGRKYFHNTPCVTRKNWRRRLASPLQPRSKQDAHSLTQVGTDATPAMPQRGERPCARILSAACGVWDKKGSVNAEDATGRESTGSKRSNSVRCSPPILAGKPRVIRIPRMTRRRRRSSRTFPA